MMGNATLEMSRSLIEICEFITREDTKMQLPVNFGGDSEFIQVVMIVNRMAKIPIYISNHKAYVWTVEGTV